MANFKEIQIGADGQVYQVKDETARNNAGGYTPPDGGIPKADLAPAVQTSLGLADTALQAADKTQLQSAINAVQTALNTLMNGQSVTDAIDTFNEIITFLDGIDTDDPKLFNQLKALSDTITALQTTLANKANDADVVKGINDSNGNALPKNQSGVITLPAVQAGDQVSVIQPDPADGTFTILVGADAYTINLNHSHTQYAPKKIVESNSNATVTLSADVIYDLGTVAGNKTINLPSTVDQAADYEFRLKYTSGTITLPSGVTVANNATLTFTAGKTYQVIISGGILYFSETTVSA